MAGLAEGEQARMLLMGESVGLDGQGPEPRGDEAHGHAEADRQGPHRSLPGRAMPASAPTDHSKWRYARIWLQSVSGLCPPLR